MANDSQRKTQDPLAYDAHETDPPLLRDHSQFRSYTTSRYTYPKIRTFYRQHAKAEQLPGVLPLLVCVPGLGGSAAQFHPLLSSLVDLGPCMAIDWPGGGRSDFEPRDWDAYTTSALCELMETIIEEHRDKDAGQTVVLIGHSMGTAISAWLANRKVDHKSQLAEFVIGLIVICPVSGPPNEAKTLQARRLMYIPGWVLDIFRAWDGIGGTKSASVNRFIGKDPEPEGRLLQYRFNKQSRTPVFRRMLYGMLPAYSEGQPHGGLPKTDIWAGLQIPVFLVSGQDDKVTPPVEVDKILAAMKGAGIGVSETTSEVPLPDSAAPINASARASDHVPQTLNDISEANFGGNVDRADRPPNDPHEDPHDDPSTPLESPADIPAQPRHPAQTIQTMTMPSPASHALLFTPRTVRVLAGLISDFLCKNITGRLSLGWQLQHLSREGKWDVKNLNKWKSVTPVSHPIGPAEAPIFRAMKTLREADDVHCPKEFVAHWGKSIKDVVDISKDQPVYDSRGLERAGIHYHKFPTVSKIPPTAEEVEAFIKKIDGIRACQADRARDEGWGASDPCLIGVHCHYGFNRTGYFVVCYLVERCGYSLREAIDAFAKARPNGIRHSHFLDRLYVRYSVENPANV